jgi:hypothetical protein
MMRTAFGAGPGAAGPRTGSRHSATPKSECKSDGCCYPNDQTEVQFPELETDKQPEEFETDQPPYYHRDIF